jgi:hypothetical protein
VYAVRIEIHLIALVSQDFLEEFQDLPAVVDHHNTDTHHPHLISPVVWGIG